MKETFRGLYGLQDSEVTAEELVARRGAGRREVLHGYVAEPRSVGR